jgi:hypothetical protein
MNDAAFDLEIDSDIARVKDEFTTMRTQIVAFNGSETAVYFGHDWFAQ